VTAAYLRIVPLAYCLQGVLMLSTVTLNVLHRPFHAAALGIGQMFVLCVPLAYAGARLFDVRGVFGAIAVSYLIAGFAAYRVANKNLVRDVKVYDTVGHRPDGTAGERG
jgi:Na+-driven multidrug efflux pump